MEKIGDDHDVVVCGIVLGGANAKHGGSARRDIVIRIYDVVEERVGVGRGRWRKSAIVVCMVLTATFVVHSSFQDIPLNYNSYVRGI